MKKTIRAQIIISTLLISIIPLLWLGIGNIFSARMQITDLVTNDINDMIDYAVARAEWELISFQNIAIDMGVTPVMSNPATTDEERAEMIAQMSAIHGLVRGNYIYPNGIAIDGNDFSDREYFKQSMNGIPWISEPVVSKVTGDVNIVFSAPVWANGIANSEVVGVVYFVPDGEFLNDIVRSLSLSENSAAYMIDKNGYTIADIDSETVKNGERVEDWAKEDKTLSGLASIHLKMQSGASGFEDVNIFGDPCYIAYRPIKGTNGWSLGVWAPENDFFHTVNTLMLINIAIVAVGVLAAVIFSLKLGSTLGKPIQKITERISQLTEGDISSPLPEIKSNNEIGVLAEKTDFLLGFLKSIIGDVSNVLQELSEGNLTVKKEISASSYVGEFSPIATSMHNLKEGLTTTITQMSETSNQVNISSAQLSNSAQSLAQGAAEQADSVGELATMLRSMSGQIESNRNDCVKAKTLSDDAKANVEAAVEKSTELHNAMSDISEASGSIGNIIKTIDDIAFQTNILALNAAIEAARAGVAGKGFAVVADEVRNLATKSSEAVQETSALIERSNTSVKRGAEIAEEMKEAMRTVDKCTDEVAGIIGLVTEASNAQADNVAHITTGIDKITSVVQSNTAAAEETAAASEELTGQANNLNAMVGRYRM